MQYNNTYYTSFYIDASATIYRSVIVFIFIESLLHRLNNITLENLSIQYVPLQSLHSFELIVIREVPLLVCLFEKLEKSFILVLSEREICLPHQI